MIRLLVSFILSSFLIGCASVEVTTPTGAQLKTVTFLKDITAKKFIVRRITEGSWSLEVSDGSSTTAEEIEAAIAGAVKVVGVMK